MNPAPPKLVRTPDMKKGMRPFASPAGTQNVEALRIHVAAPKKMCRVKKVYLDSSTMIPKNTASTVGGTRMA